MECSLWNGINFEGSYEPVNKIMNEFEVLKTFKEINSVTVFFQIQSSYWIELQHSRTATSDISEKKYT